MKSLKSLWKTIKAFIKKIFSKNDYSQNIDNSKNVKQSIKGDNNNVVNGSQNNVNYGTQNYHYSNEYIEKQHNTLFVIKMRWNKFIPYYIVDTSTQFEKGFSFVTDDKDFVKAKYNLEISDNCDKNGGLYIAFYKELTICNLKIESLRIKTDECEIDASVNKTIFGIIEEDKAIVVNHQKLRESNGEITILISYEKDDNRYQQNFRFRASKDSKTFVLLEYESPVLQNQQMPIGL